MQRAVLICSYNLLNYANLVKDCKDNTTKAIKICCIVCNTEHPANKRDSAHKAEYDACNNVHCNIENDSPYKRLCILKLERERLRSYQSACRIYS